MDSDETLQPVVGEPAGQQLKRAREQKGLSVSAVADAQHLRPAVIQAIEDGDYEQIDSELFLKGYVRTYARQVDLDPDAVVATLDKELEPLRQEKAQAEELNPLVDIERRRRQKRRIAKLLFFLLVIAIAAFVGLRFLDNTGFTPEPEGSGSTDPVSEAAEPVESGPENTDVSGSDTTDENLGAAETEPLDTGPATDDPALAERDPLAPSEEQSDMPPVTESEFGEAGETDQEQVAVPTETIEEDRVPVVTSAPEPTFEESAQPDAAVGRAQLEMTFIDECWVQVTDSAGNRLVGSLQRNGDQIDVTGRVPLEVVIGAVDAIGSIRFDGEPVDMSGFRVINNRAEFTLDI